MPRPVAQPISLSVDAVGRIGDLPGRAVTGGPTAYRPCGGSLTLRLSLPDAHDSRPAARGTCPTWAAPCLRLASMPDEDSDGSELVLRLGENIHRSLVALAATRGMRPEEWAIRALLDAMRDEHAS